MRGVRHTFMLAAGAATLALAFAGPATWASAATPARPATTVASVDSFGAIACPTSKACVAVGSAVESEDGKSAVINASTGAVTTWPGTETESIPEAVACPSSSTCLADGTDMVASVKVSSGAMKVTDTPKKPEDGIVSLSRIACATSTRCYAVGWEGPPTSSTAIAIRLSGTGKQLAVMKDAGTGIGNIACPSASRCLVSDATPSGERVQVLSDKHFGVTHTLLAGHSIERIACYKADACYALGFKIGKSNEIPINEIFPLNPKTGAIGKMTTISGGFSGNDMTCPSASRCLIIGHTGWGASSVAALVTMVNGKPGKVTRPGTDTASYGAIGCASATVCYVVGQAPGDAGAIVTKV